MKTKKILPDNFTPESQDAARRIQNFGEQHHLFHSKEMKQWRAFWKRNTEGLTIFVERDQFADPEAYPDGIAWRSGVVDANGEEIDGGGDIATYEEALDLAVSTLARLIGE